VKWQNEPLLEKVLCYYELATLPLTIVDLVKETWLPNEIWASIMEPFIAKSMIRYQPVKLFRLALVSRLFSYIIQQLIFPRIENVNTVYPPFCDLLMFSSLHNLDTRYMTIIGTTLCKLTSLISLDLSFNDKITSKFIFSLSLSFNE
jgi:hypothetical protein